MNSPIDKIVEVKGEEYNLKQVTRELIPDFLALFNHNRNKSYSLEHFQIKYAQVPGADTYFGFMLYKNGKAVAHTGALPFWATYNGKKHLIANLTDSVTDNSFQRKGLNSFLLNYLETYCLEQGVSFIYRLSKPLTSFLSVEKYNFIHAMDLQTLIVKTKNIPFYKALTKFGGLPLYQKFFDIMVRTFYTKADVTQFEKRADCLSITKDTAFENHKKFEKNWKVKLNKDLAVWFRLDYGLLVGDLNFESKEDLKIALKKLERMCFWLGLDNIKIRIATSHKLSNFFSDFGNVEPSNPIMIKDLKKESIYQELVITAIDGNTF